MGMEEDTSGLHYGVRISLANIAALVCLITAPNDDASKALLFVSRISYFLQFYRNSCYDPKILAYAAFLVVQCRLTAQPPAYFSTCTLGTWGSQSRTKFQE